MSANKTKTSEQRITRDVFAALMISYLAKAQQRFGLDSRLRQKVNKLIGSLAKG